jgi:hypothetical protein
MEKGEIMTDKDMEFPPLIFEDEPPPISKPPVCEVDFVAEAMKTVLSKHERIGNTLKSIWGYQECSDYLQKLVYNGSDPADLNRTGFNPEVADALMLLSEVHKVTKS